MIMNPQGFVNFSKIIFAQMAEFSYENFLEGYQIANIEKSKMSMPTRTCLRNKSSPRNKK